MCTSPQYITNPYYGQWKYFNRKTSSIGLNFLHDCHSFKMVVPCGVCEECLFLKQQYLLQRVELLSTDHFVFFGTLTLNNKHIKVVTDSKGNKHQYVDSNYFYHMLHRIRFRGEIPKDSKIMYVVEYGSRRHRPHVHFMLFYPHPANLDFRFPAVVRSYIDREEKRLYDLFYREWSINVGTRKNPKYEPLFTYKEVMKNGVLYRNFDFHLVRTESVYDIYTISPNYKGRTELDVAAYVTKYVLKYDKWFTKKKQYLHSVLPPDEYDKIIKLIKPRVTISKHFGDNPKYAPLVRKGIEYSLSLGQNFKGWKFFSRQSGTYKPLCKYLQQKFLTVDDMMAYWFTCSTPNQYSDSNVVITHYDSREHGIDTSVQPREHGRKVFSYLDKLSADDSVCIEEFDF